MLEPDITIKEIFNDLASVGKAFNDTYSEDNLETGDGFYQALESLNKFKKGCDNLVLDEATKKGLDDLIDYLHKKIERRATYVGT